MQQKLKELQHLKNNYGKETVTFNLLTIITQVGCAPFMYSAGSCITLYY